VLQCQQGDQSKIIAPVPSELTSADAVRAAIAEFDALGRDAFLEKYGFRRSDRYMLQANGGLYDSKAIVGAAFGFQYPTAALCLRTPSVAARRRSVGSSRSLASWWLT
jgi:hypothetical protein